MEIHKGNNNYSCIADVIVETILVFIKNFYFKTFNFFGSHLLYSNTLDFKIKLLIKTKIVSTIKSAILI